MAKRGTRPEGASEDELPVTLSGRDVEDRVTEFAEDLGRILGTTQARAAAWLDQRKAIAEQLTQVRDTANQLLARLTGGSTAVAAALKDTGRRTRKRVAKAARKTRRTMSPEARERIAEAQRRRWAKQKREKKKDSEQ